MHIYITTDIFPHVLEVYMFYRESSGNKGESGVKCAFWQGVLEERSAWAKSNVKTRPNTQHIAKEEAKRSKLGLGWGLAATALARARQGRARANPSTNHAESNRNLLD